MSRSDKCSGLSISIASLCTHPKPCSLSFSISADAPVCAKLEPGSLALCPSHMDSNPYSATYYLDGPGKQLAPLCLRFSSQKGAE